MNALFKGSGLHQYIGSTCENTLRLSSILLNVFEPSPGGGIRTRVAESVFEYHEELGPSAIVKLSPLSTIKDLLLNLPVNIYDF